jgi:hypothetical protein
MKKFPKNYAVSVVHNEHEILQKKFYTLTRAEKWACKTVRAILVCDCPATILNTKTGEIMTIISR